MNKKRKDLPAKSDVNRDTDHDRYSQQEEFDNKKGRGAASEVRNDRESEHMKDSQEGDERMLPESKRKQSPEDYRTDRKLPQTKK